VGPADQENDQTEQTRDLSKGPKAHSNFGFWPADGLEMVVDWRRQKYPLAMTKFAAITD